MSVFYQLSERILLEIDYTQTQFNGVSVPVVKTVDGNEGSVVLSGNTAAQYITNNGLNTVFVKDKLQTFAVLDENTAYDYTNVDPDITVTQLPVSNVGLQYITLRFHVLAGFNFQGLAGMLFSVWLKSSSNTNIYLLRQFFSKTDIGRYKFNEIAKNIGDLYYDKYVEFYVLDYADILNGGVNLGYLQNDISVGSQNLLYASLGEVSEVDFKAGYQRVLSNETKAISFSASDQFNSLTAYIEEHPNGYFQYCAKWGGSSIESFIYAVNQLNGNAYYIIHELEVYEQVGSTLVKRDVFTQIQTDNYDTMKRFRPILSGSVDGGIKIVYTARLYNKNNGDSIIKSSTLSTLNVSPYLEEIQKINIVQSENPIKVYNKIVSESVSMIGNSTGFSKVIVPIYINAMGTMLGDGSNLKLTQFDNFYEISIYQDTGAGKHIFQIDGNAKHKMLFTKTNGSNISVDEIIIPEKRKYGILTFKISGEEAKLIVANGIKTFHIVSESPNGIVTELVSGTIIT